MGGDRALEGTQTGFLFRVLMPLCGLLEVTSVEARVSPCKS